METSFLIAFAVDVCQTRRVIYGAVSLAKSEAAESRECSPAGRRVSADVKGSQRPRSGCL